MLFLSITIKILTLLDANISEIIHKIVINFYGLKNIIIFVMKLTHTN